jgi:hypothetical protein
MLGTLGQRLALRQRPTPPERKRAESPPQLKELPHSRPGIPGLKRTTLGRAFAVL